MSDLLLKMPLQFEPIRKKCIGVVFSGIKDLEQFTLPPIEEVKKVSFSGNFVKITIRICNRNSILLQNLKKYVSNIPFCPEGKFDMEIRYFTPAGNIYEQKSLKGCFPTEIECEDFDGEDFTISFCYDYMVGNYGVDAEKELTKILTEEITKKIDEQLMDIIKYTDKGTRDLYEGEMCVGLDGACYVQTSSGLVELPTVQGTSTASWPVKNLTLSRIDFPFSPPFQNVYTITGNGCVYIKPKKKHRIKYNFTTKVKKVKNGTRYIKIH